ncbi:MAG: hypothetical protein RL143_161 [Pseudomonadota bacterium]
MSAFKRRMPGFLVVGIVALAAAFLGEHYGTPVLLLSLLLGLATNFLYESPGVSLGVDFSATTLLRAGVALLGARISFEALLHFGPLTLLLLALMVVATIIFGTFIARFLGLERDLGTLTGCGVGICGASATVAIAAVSPKNENSERATAVTIIGITVMSAIAMVAYPLLGHWLGMDDRQLGFFLGSSIHDVAQVVGAGYSVSPETGDDATLIKLIRVAMLAPIVFALGTFYSRKGVTKGKPGFAVPGFLWIFIVLMTVNSLGHIPPMLQSNIQLLSSSFLIAAIAAIGLRTQPSKLRGISKPLLILIALETLFIGLVSALLALWV